MLCNVMFCFVIEIMLEFNIIQATISVKDLCSEVKIFSIVKAGCCFFKCSFKKKMPSSGAQGKNRK